MTTRITTEMSENENLTKFDSVEPGWYPDICVLPDIPDFNASSLSHKLINSILEFATLFPDNLLVIISGNDLQGKPNF